MNLLGIIKCFDRLTLRRIISAALIVFWCIVIFNLSAQSGEESSQTSAGFTERFCELIVPKFSGIDEAKRKETVESLQFIVRKSAHFTAYFILSLLSLAFFSTVKRLKKPLYQAAAAAGFCMLYAVSDEIHQLFVPGRSAQIRDVLIDTSGALLAAAATLGIKYLLNRRNKRTKNHDT